MKRMRQIAGFILAVVIIFGLSGCQDKKKRRSHGSIQSSGCYREKKQ